MYDEQDPYDGRIDCHQCQEKDETLRSAQEFLEAMIETLYSKQAINWPAFEMYMEELCFHLDVKVPDKQISFPKIAHDILPEWVVSNNQYLKSLKMV